MNKEEKIKIVSSLSSSLAASKNIYLTDISGLDAEQTGILRRMCFEKNVSLSVVKNTLLKKAMDACDKDFTDFDKILKGNTALMVSDVANAPAKVIKKFLEKVDTGGLASCAQRILRLLTFELECCCLQCCLFLAARLCSIGI